MRIARRSGSPNNGALVYRFLGLFALPDLVGQVVDDRQLQFVVSLVEGGHAKTLHNGVAVFQSIAQPAGGGIDKDPIGGHSEVLQQDIDLFGEVDVDRRRRNDRVTITHGRGTDTLVVLVLNRSEDKRFVLAGFGDFFQDLLVLLNIRASPDDQRHIDGIGNFFDGCGRSRRHLYSGRSDRCSSTGGRSARHRSLSTHFLAQAAGSESTSLNGTKAASGQSSGSMSQTSMAILGLLGTSPSNW